MNRDLEPDRKPVILEGEIISPDPSGEYRREDGQPRVQMVKLGWFGKTLAILSMMAIFAAVLVLAAGAVLILLPIAIIAAIWGWWRIRKLKI
jgi:hypothetical protein